MKVLFFSLLSMISVLETASAGGPYYHWVGSVCMQVDSRGTPIRMVDGGRRFLCDEADGGPYYHWVGSVCMQVDSRGTPIRMVDGGRRFLCDEADEK